MVEQWFNIIQCFAIIQLCPKLHKICREDILLDLTQARFTCSESVMKATGKCINSGQI